MYRKNLRYCAYWNIKNVWRNVLERNCKNSKIDFDKISRTIQAENLFCKENFSRRLQQE